MIPSFGPTELVILLFLVLLLFGAKRIPELARGLGSGVSEFRKGVSGKKDDESQEEVREGNRDEELPAAGEKERDEAENANTHAAEQTVQQQKP